MRIQTAGEHASFKHLETFFLFATGFKFIFIPVETSELKQECKQPLLLKSDYFSDIKTSSFIFTEVSFHYVFHHKISRKIYGIYVRILYTVRQEIKIKILRDVIL